MSIKNYPLWHAQEPHLNARAETPYFYEREVWWTAIGCNVGFEEDGKAADFSRPVLIVRKYNYRFFLGIPLSSTDNIGRYYYQFQDSPGFHTALLSQIRSFDAKRLINPAGLISAADLATVRFQTAAIITGHKKVLPPLLGA